MNDQSIHSAAKISLATGAAIWLALAAPAHAGDKVIYGDAPEWVDKVALSRVNVESDPSALIYDWQHRLENGVVSEYADTAIRIDNPDLLMEHGTVTLAWLPDKGDLTVHHVQIIRGAEIIDVSASGADRRTADEK